jgi:hypothetical protein
MEDRAGNHWPNSEESWRCEADSIQAAVRNIFIRGSVVRYVHLPGSAVDTALLEDGKSPFHLIVELLGLRTVWRGSWMTSNLEENQYADRYLNSNEERSCAASSERKMMTSALPA